MRWIMILAVALVACDEPAECEQASGGGSSGAAASSSESSGGESTGEPAAPTCGELLACYEAECEEIMAAWIACTGYLAQGPYFTRIPYCTPPSSDAGLLLIDIACRDAADMGPSDDYGANITGCIYEAVVTCTEICGAHDLRAFEAMRSAMDPEDNVVGAYSSHVRAHCV